MDSSATTKKEQTEFYTKSEARSWKAKVSYREDGEAYKDPKWQSLAENNPQ